MRKQRGKRKKNGDGYDNKRKSIGPASDWATVVEATAVLWRWRQKMFSWLPSCKILVRCFISDFRTILYNRQTTLHHITPQPYVVSWFLRSQKPQSYNVSDICWAFGPADALLKGGSVVGRMVPNGGAGEDGSCYTLQYNYRLPVCFILHNVLAIPSCNNYGTTNALISLPRTELSIHIKHFYFLFYAHLLRCNFL